MNSNSIISLAGHAKIKKDSVRDSNFLLVPERAIKLNETAFGILSLCDGSLTVRQISESLEENYKSQDVSRDITEFLEDMLLRGWIEIVGEKS